MRSRLLPEHLKTRDGTLFISPGCRKCLFTFLSFKVIHLVRDANGAGLHPTTSSYRRQLKISVKLVGKTVQSLSGLHALSIGKIVKVIPCCDRHFGLFSDHLRDHLRELSARRSELCRQLSWLAELAAVCIDLKGILGSNCSCACLFPFVCLSVCLFVIAFHCKAKLDGAQEPQEERGTFNWITYAHREE